MRNTTDQPNRPRSRAKPATSPSTKTPRDVIDFAIWRDVLLTRRAEAGDVDAIIAWLKKFGGPEWNVDA